MVFSYVQNRQTGQTPLSNERALSLCFKSGVFPETRIFSEKGEKVFACHATKKVTAVWFESKICLYDSVGGKKLEEHIPQFGICGKPFIRHSCGSTCYGIKRSGVSYPNFICIHQGKTYETLIINRVWNVGNALIYSIYEFPDTKPVLLLYNPDQPDSSDEISPSKLVRYNNSKERFSCIFPNHAVAKSAERIYFITIFHNEGWRQVIDYNTKTNRHHAYNLKIAGEEVLACRENNGYLYCRTGYDSWKIIDVFKKNVVSSVEIPGAGLNSLVNYNFAVAKNRIYYIRSGSGNSLMVCDHKGRFASRELQLDRSPKSLSVKNGIVGIKLVKNENGTDFPRYFIGAETGAVLNQEGLSGVNRNAAWRFTYGDSKLHKRFISLMGERTVEIAFFS